MNLITDSFIPFANSSGRLEGLDRKMWLKVMVWSSTKHLCFCLGEAGCKDTRFCLHQKSSCASSVTHPSWLIWAVVGTGGSRGATSWVWVPLQSEYIFWSPVIQLLLPLSVKRNVAVTALASGLHLVSQPQEQRILFDCYLYKYKMLIKKKYC